MQHIVSLDPRITRELIPTDFDAPAEPKEELDQLQSYEVFQQLKSGGRFTHVGSVHASTPDVALIFAKEQYGRRGQTFGFWVVQTDNIHALEVEDIDIFDTAATPEKAYREVAAYAHIREKIEAFRKTPTTA